MRRRKIPIFVLVASLLLSVVNTPLMNALEVGTHEKINERISFGDFDGFSLNAYLTNQLGISGGINELFVGKTVSRWIRDGGRYEDEPPWTIPYVRSVNHYHDPTREQGFSGFFHGRLLSGYSLVEWAQMPIGAQSPGGHYSWNDARDYFYRALTSVNNADRERNFSETFRSLGQLMHLVHDASVPAHTRNDPHVSGYEKWVQKNTDINTINPIFFNNSILGRPTSGLPIANIFDTNQYDGNNPQVAVGTSIGLTEYTHANFFSEDTINSKDFAYPRIDSNTEIVGRSYINPLGTYTRQYYLKRCCGETNEGNGYLLSAVDYLDYWRQNFPLLSFGLLKIPVLDNNTYSEYVKFLIPRAIGYSSGLLKYFFRGRIEITLPETGVYALLERDLQNPQQGFRQLSLLAKNTSSDGEELTYGSIELVVKYKLALQDPFQPLPVPTSDEFYYIVVPETNNTTSIPRANPVKLTFNLSQNAIPLYATDVSLQVVYYGMIGGEGRQVAVGFKDISEPTPIDIYNDMDRECINGSWYVAGSPEALALGNQFNFDAYPHHLRNIYLRFSPINNPQGASPTDFNLHIPSLDAGDFFIREAFVLSDYQFNNGYRVTVVNANPNDPYVTWFEPGVILYKGMKNQTEPGTPEQCAALNVGYPCDIRYYPDHFYSFRGQEIWEWIVFQNASYPPGSSCPLE